jgi:hypothetical protein
MILRILWCNLFGHNYVKAFKHFNGQSYFGLFICSRCYDHYEWQLDLPQIK